MDRTDSCHDRPPGPKDGQSAAALPFVAQAQQHQARVAVVDERGRSSYGELLAASQGAAAGLLDGRADLAEARVAFLVSPGFEYAAVQWGIWRAGGIAVPLAVMHPPAELAYTIDDSAASILVADAPLAGKLEPLARQRGLRFVRCDELLAGPESPLPAVAPERRAMMLYTSGTTSKPKGVVTTHRTIDAQIRSLIEAWRWTADDCILHVLPLHHIHGIINVLGCALWSGAACRFLPRFDAEQVWAEIAESRDLTLLMAVPTIYARLISAWEEAPPDRREAMSAGCRRMRLMVSGSAALPVSTLERWRTISGHTLLERYGMTEIGMALSNPYDGERHAGAVGGPLPGVEVRLRGEDGSPAPEGSPGEIQVRGPNVFSEYWQRPEATAAGFTSDGWFKTGDVAVCERGVYRILGRESIDIIKTGGYKVSALEIEEVLLTHPAVQACAVVGAADEQWGQRVCAAVVLAEGHALDLPSLRTWAKEQLAPYKVPSRLLVVDELPRNAMGKVTKPELAARFET